MLRFAVALSILGTAAQSQIVDARYTEPTSRYPHAVLGDGIEHAGLEVTLSDGRRLTAVWPDTIVFEDTEPRVIDLDGDGSAEVITVESHENRGARLAVWGLTEEGTLDALGRTPFIGTRFRWLAPVGAADMTGDGKLEIAYVDRPHLAKTLRVWSYDPDGGANENMTLLGDFVGVTNHRIGERDIAGGIRKCGAGPEMIVANANWTQLLSVKFDGTFATTQIGTDTSRAAFATAMDC